jgi:hypothetical protein
MRSRGNGCPGAPYNSFGRASGSNCNVAENDCGQAFSRARTSRNR